MKSFLLKLYLFFKSDAYILRRTAVMELRQKPRSYRKMLRESNKIMSELWGKRIAEEMKRKLPFEVQK